MKEEGSPRKSVTESSFVAAKVMRTLKRIRAVRRSAEVAEERNPPVVPTKKTVRMAMRAGNRPLQGTKLLVRMARSLSLGESMMRHPTTPAALHPRPMHMVG